VPIDAPAAEIPVQDIRGPVLLDCGTDDLVWTSCAYALRIENRLNATHDRYPHVVYRYEGARHYVDLLVPCQPDEVLAELATPTGEGNALLANANAHARLWPHVLAFLAHSAMSTGVFSRPATAPPLPGP
jgi:BAAT / Acyl-CoA thioester hydrolase C terminal